MKPIEWFKLVKQEYCGLFDFKIHNDGATLELITPNSTITDKFVSVFLTVRDKSIIITDGGWVSGNMYDADLFYEDELIANNLISQLLSQYNIEETINAAKKPVYFKSTNRIESIPSLVFDVSTFIQSVVNVYALELKVKKDNDDRDRFKSNMNEYFYELYEDQFDSRFDFGGVRFSGKIQQGSKMHLIEYVTGSTKYYFNTDLRKAIVNFQVILDSDIQRYVGERICIFNDNSNGYQVGPSAVLVNHLKKSTTQNILTWTSRNKIKDYITSLN